MKRGNATVLLIAMVALGALTWISVIGNQGKIGAQHIAHIAAAEKFVEKGVYIDAVQQYQEALKLQSQDYETTMKLASVYKQLNDTTGFTNTCDKAISLNDTRVEAYALKLNYYMEQEKYKEAFGVLQGAGKVREQEAIAEIAAVLKTQYTQKYLAVTEMSDVHTQQKTDYFTANKGGEWGLYTQQGKRAFPGAYTYIGAYSEQEGVAPCCLDGEYFYVDKEGNRKLVGDKAYQYLGSFGNGFAPAMLEGKYGYINRAFEEFHFEYTYAGAFANGVAAAKKDGKWGLINTEFMPITEFVYEDIKVDSSGYSSVFGLVVAKKDGKYQLINLKGEILSEGYDNARLPAEKDGWIAVQKNNQWGFVDWAGTWMIEPSYQDAASFSLGFAPVKTGEAWGYIDTQNKLVIEANFAQAKAFSPNGMAQVSVGEQWNIIVLCAYE